MRFFLLLCLVAPAFCEQRIFGGSDVDIASHPHMLSLRVSGLHTCGAVLISYTDALTAAQCCGSPIGVYTLLGGTSDRTVTDCATCVLLNLTAIKKNPGYEVTENGFSSDLAVLKFDFTSYNPNFEAIELAQFESGTFEGDRCFITGWGQLNGGGNQPQQLQGAAVTVMTNTECAAEWGAASINDGHICATDANAGACNGDTGGPMVCGNLLAGLTSFGIDNCSPGRTSVYTRISFYYLWITVA